MQIGQFITGRQEKEKAVRKMKWLAKLIGLENKFSSAKKCIKTPSIDERADGQLAAVVAESLMVVSCKCHSF